ncbi:hypothetical protein TraAM80_02187 [Trypanosoma rangeli]|uniref:Uncharacterized protein n=1 Tax=Trypanosoma rangeli TaxID=5698 RepID=A0A422NVA8_TRYRA|nr:uncharacterized protein TraAM80_02187 [Trypanosoma rangeli]RNF09390.1 hypothetical protein TraAM80_02187 [Trypanosoma rangeli]|eukprot:RNF09390.1 hypothetical protein TraAM80_02187 [Trypanosoma rangeli]
MSTPQLLEHVRETSRLLASETHLPREEVQAAFETIRLTEAGYEVMYTVTVDDGRDSRRVLLCHGVNEAEKVQASFDEARFDVYALQKQGNTVKFAPWRSTPSLVPSDAVMRREYRVVTREEAASRLEGGGETQTSLETAAASLKSSAGPTECGTQPQAKPATVGNEIVETKQQPQESSRESQQPNLTSLESFLKTPLSGAKRTRAADGAKRQADAKPKKPRVTNRKNGNAEGTQSLMKLAKASAKKKKDSNGSLDRSVPTPAAACASMQHNLLDEDDEAVDRSSSSSSSSSSSRGSFVRRDEALLNEDLPAIDVAVFARENDGIILCDDAPPMVFCAPGPAAGALKKEQQKQLTQWQQESMGSATQAKLTGFFQPGVIDFQKQYVREMETDMVIKDGEYICKDVVCFRHKGTNEVISQEEFHRRSSEIMRGLRSDTQSGSPSESTLADQGSPSSPTGNAKFTAVEAAKRSRPPKIEKQLRSQPKTLFAYFKPASS